MWQGETRCRRVDTIGRRVSGAWGMQVIVLDFPTQMRFHAPIAQRIERLLPKLRLRRFESCWGCLADEALPNRFERGLPVSGNLTSAGLTSDLSADQPKCEQGPKGSHQDSSNQIERVHLVSPTQARPCSDQAIEDEVGLGEPTKKHQ